jgi:hypothetical protein
MQAFTLRRCKDPEKATEQLYLSHLKRLCDRLGLKIHHLYFEQTNGLHCHGTFDLTKPVQEKMLRTRGWNLKLKDIYDLKGWFLYITKDIPNLTIADLPMEPDTPVEQVEQDELESDTDVQTERMEQDNIPTLKKKLF